MKTKRLLKFLFIAIIVFVGMAFVLAYYPIDSPTQHVGISEIRAAALRDELKDPHHLVRTTDGETLFLRRWNPDPALSDKEEVAILILHGITAHSGAYDMAGRPFSERGYTTFGLDYRGHGLSGGNRGDAPGVDRWIADMAETVAYIKIWGFLKWMFCGTDWGLQLPFLWQKLFRTR